MDYKVMTIHDDGSFTDRYCATRTDVENEIVAGIRHGFTTDNVVTTVHVFDLTKQDS